MTFVVNGTQSTTSQCAVVTSQRGANQQTFSASYRDDVMPWMERPGAVLAAQVTQAVVDTNCRRSNTMHKYRKHFNMPASHHTPEAFFSSTSIVRSLPLQES
ncbi:hypothetical protein Q8A73_023017 [Channa argus]|nr:hypothetical protein Q8A73_023017 [Channa argus]